MAGSDRVPPAEISSEVGEDKIFPARAKWRSSPSACGSAPKQALDRADSFIDAPLRVWKTVSLSASESRRTLRKFRVPAVRFWFASGRNWKSTARLEAAPQGDPSQNAKALDQCNPWIQCIAF